MSHAQSASTGGLVAELALHNFLHPRLAMRSGGPTKRGHPIRRLFQPHISDRAARWWSDRARDRASDSSASSNARLTVRASTVISAFSRIKRSGTSSMCGSSPSSVCNCRMPRAKRSSREGESATFPHGAVDKQTSRFCVGSEAQWKKCRTSYSIGPAAAPFLGPGGSNERGLRLLCSEDVKRAVCPLDLDDRHPAGALDHARAGCGKGNGGLLVWALFFGAPVRSRAPLSTLGRRRRDVDDDFVAHALPKASLTSLAITLTRLPLLTAGIGMRRSFLLHSFNLGHD